MEINSMVRDFINFISNYNTQYGTIQLIETPKNFVVECYNGGWSENEELEREMSRVYRGLLVYHQHPIHIFVIPKFSAIYFLESKKSFSIEEMKKSLSPLKVFTTKRTILYKYKMEVE